MRYFKNGDVVKTPYGIGVVKDSRFVEGTKHQTNKRNKMDYLVSFKETIYENYIDWFEDYRVKPLECNNLRKDEARDLRGKIKRVKKVGIYNDRTHFVGNYYLFYDEDEVYHLENKEKKEIVVTFRARNEVEAKAIAILYTYE